MTQDSKSLPRRRSDETATPHIARAAAVRIRIASNPWPENATLNALMEQRAHLNAFGVDTVTVEAEGVAGPFDKIAAGEADVCMVSGYAGVIPRIAQGTKIKIIGAGMRKSALTILASANKIQTLPDLTGRSVAVGPNHGLLHILMLQLLREKGLDASRVKFLNVGSNDQCYHAVVAGEADACCTSISHLNDGDGLAVVSGGNIWEALPRYTFQTAYAADIALKDKREGIVAVMAAYGALYEYLMKPESHDAYFEARKKATTRFNEGAAQANWDFIQSQRPYSKDLSLSDNAIDYLQDVWAGLGVIRQRHPVTVLADSSAANEAAQLLG